MTCLVHTCGSISQEQAYEVWSCLGSLSFVFASEMWVAAGYHDGYTDTDEETEDDSQDQDEVVEPYEEQSEEASKGGQQDAADEESETDLEQESGQDGESYTLEWRMFEDGDGN